jgi:hypothetical protein
MFSNATPENEKLLSFEAGYLGRFFDGRLSVGWDISYSYHTHFERHDPCSGRYADLMESLPCLNPVGYLDAGRDILNSTMSIRLEVSRSISLLANWTHREAFDSETGKSDDQIPKNLIALGGRFKTSFGLLGSLYAFSRSEYRDHHVQDAEGLLMLPNIRHMDNALIVTSKIGWTVTLSQGIDFEAGVKLFLPVSPFSGSLFRYRELAGGVDREGRHFGGEQLSRLVTGYLQGTF